MSFEQGRLVADGLRFRLLEVSYQISKLGIKTATLNPTCTSPVQVGFESLFFAGFFAAAWTALTFRRYGSR